MINKNIFLVYGFATLVGGWLSFVYIFMYAFFNGYEVVVNVNRLGEANLEFAMIIVGFFCMLLLFRRMYYGRVVYDDNE